VKRITLVLFTFLVFATVFSSCGSVSEKTISRFTPHYYYIKCAMSDEIKFVQQIMDNPQDIQHIIESSKYYDTTVTEFYFLQKENPDKDIYAKYIEWLIDFEPKFHIYLLNKGAEYVYGYETNETIQNFRIIELRRTRYGEDFWWTSLHHLAFVFVKISGEYKLETMFIIGKGALLPQIHYVR
jgi:hypothetical protein